MGIFLDILLKPPQPLMGLFFTHRKELNVENKTEDIETLNFSEPEVCSRIRII